MFLTETSHQDCIGHSRAFCRALEVVNTIASRECTVVLFGESGTGKEMLARRIHHHSRRGKGPFVPVDCTSISGELFSSQLFGHVKGAFTGADRDTLGFFAAADGGTIFLDEIGELPLGLQGKFLRVLQESKITPVGSTREYHVDVRVLCATNRDLDRMVEEGTFKRDLYYRLKVIELRVPPLRDRREDIVPLAQHFLRKQSLRYHEPVRGLPTDVIRVLEAYDWPGNVRELANALEHACALSKLNYLRVSDLPETVRIAASNLSADDDGEVVPLEVAEKALVVKALRVAGGNKSRAARMLKIERRRLCRMVDRYQLEPLVGRVSSDLAR